MVLRSHLTRQENERMENSSKNTTFNKKVRRTVQNESSHKKVVIYSTYWTLLYKPPNICNWFLNEITIFSTSTNIKWKKDNCLKENWKGQFIKNNCICIKDNLGFKCKILFFGRTLPLSNIPYLLCGYCFNSIAWILKIYYFLLFFQHLDFFSIDFSIGLDKHQEEFINNKHFQTWGLMVY